MSIGHTKNLPALPLGLLAPDPGDFLCGQKVTKKPLKKLRFLRIFLHYGGFLFALRPVCLVFLNLFSGPMPLESLEPLPGPSAFFVGFALLLYLQHLQRVLPCRYYRAGRRAYNPGGQVQPRAYRLTGDNGCE